MPASEEDAQAELARISEVLSQLVDCGLDDDVMSSWINAETTGAATWHVSQRKASRRMCLAAVKNWKEQELMRKMRLVRVGFRSQEPL